MRWGIALSIVAATACGGPQRPDRVAERPATPDEAAEIQKVVVDAQRAGFVRHDGDAYMAQWTDDAKLVRARQEESDQHDLTIVRSRFEPTRRMQFQGDSAILAVEYADPVVTIGGGTATLRTTATLRYQGGSQVVGERYRLRRTEAGWRVFENRFWPVSTTFGDDTKVFDAQFYAAADQRVEQERAAGDTYELGLALLEAGRPLEALATLRDLTDQQDVEAYDWVLRANAALAVGDADDAKASFARALELDPGAPVPPYAR